MEIGEGFIVAEVMDFGKARCEQVEDPRSLDLEAVQPLAPGGSVFGLGAFDEDFFSTASRVRRRQPEQRQVIAAFIAGTGLFGLQGSFLIDEPGGGVRKGALRIVMDFVSLSFEEQGPARPKPA